MKKILITVLGLQLLLSVALLAKVFELDARLSRILAGQPDASEIDDFADPADRDEADAGVAGDRPLSETLLRRIVAEEVRAAVNSLPVPEPEAEIESEKMVSSAEYQQRLDHALSQLQYYMDRGEISPAEMVRLQADIALLDPESRTQVMKLLVSALSSGELDGNL